jgi:glycopeptide antibiotics resistance protein
MFPLTPTLLRLLHLIYSIIIISLAFLSINPTTSPINNSFLLSFRLDYLIHFSLFIPWMALVWLAYNINFRQTLKKAILWLLAGILFCWFTEAIQLFIPYRAFNINDLAANTLGVLLGSTFFIFPPCRKAVPCDSTNP